jgi:hypothetical protein
MPDSNSDRDNIAEVEVMTVGNEAKATIKFNGKYALKFRAPTNRLDPANNLILAEGDTFTVSINNHWRVNIRQVTVRPSSSVQQLTLHLESGGKLV